MVRVPRSGWVGRTVKGNDDPGEEPTAFAGSEDELPAVSAGDAVGDRQPEAEARMVLRRRDPCSGRASCERLGQPGQGRFRHDRAGVLHGEHCVCAVC